MRVLSRDRELGFHGVAEGLKPGAVGGESGLVLLLLTQLQSRFCPGDFLGGFWVQGFVLELSLEGLGFLSFWSTDRKFSFGRTKEASPFEERREAFLSKKGQTVFPLREKNKAYPLKE